MGPGLYQEWAGYVHAAKSNNEQNLELCRSGSNNMLYYRATRPIGKGDSLLAWYSPSVEAEIAKLLLNRDQILVSSFHHQEQCKRCMVNFEHVNVLKSHLLFDGCGKSSSSSSSIMSSVAQSSLASILTGSRAAMEAAAAAVAVNPFASMLMNDFFKNQALHKKPIFSTNSSLSVPFFNNSLNSTSPYSSSVSSSSSSSSSSISDSLKTSSAFSPIKKKILKQQTEPSSSSSILDQPPANNSSLLGPKIEIISPKYSNSSSSTSPASSISPISSSCSVSSSTATSASTTPTPVGDEDAYQELNTKSKSKKAKLSSSSGSKQSSSEKQLSSSKTMEAIKTGLADNQMGLDWKITMLDGTQTVELNMPDEQGKQKKTHVCLFCGKIYNRKYGLKIHLRTHTGYKPLKCKVCSRPFSDPSNLNKHVRLHSQGDISPYGCPYCGKILVRKRDLDRHILSRHSNSAEAVAACAASSNVAFSSNASMDGQDDDFRMDFRY